MSKLFALSGSLVLVLVIGVAGSNSNGMPQTPTCPPVRLVNFKEFLDNNLKGKPGSPTVKFERVSDKASINAQINDVFSDYVWITVTIPPPPGGRVGRTTYNYVPFSSIRYVEEEQVVGVGVVFTVGVDVK